MANHSVAERLMVKPGSAADLSARDPGATHDAPGDERITAAVANELNNELAELHNRLTAEAAQSLLVVLQAIDAGGKDGTIRRVFSGVNPQGCEVTSFKVPTEEERAHDFLWRVHKAAPSKGQIGIFNRSHYEDVLVVRVHNSVPKREWQARYRMINDFEHILAASGTTIVKLFLNISREEQAARFRKRLEQPQKNWKFRQGDLDERAYWDDYQLAFEDALTKTSTKEAPWYVIPANHKWYRDWAVLTILVETLRRMNPKYPHGEDLSGVIVV